MGMANYLCFWYVAGQQQPIMTTLGFNKTFSFAAYFIIQNPGNSTQLVNNVANVISWTKGAGDGIMGFDLEMTRMSVDGLFLIARNGEYVMIERYFPKSHLYYAFSSIGPRRNQHILRKRSTRRRLLFPLYKLYHRANVCTF